MIFYKEFHSFFEQKEKKNEQNRTEHVQYYEQTRRLL